MDEKLTRVRSEEVRVKFIPDMKKRVDRIAEMHGMPAATWCHNAIAQAVIAFERQWQLQNRTQEQLVSQISGMLPDIVQQIALSGEAIEAGGGTEGPLGPEADGAEGGVKG